MNDLITLTAKFVEFHFGHEEKLFKKDNFGSKNSFCCHGNNVFHITSMATKPFLIEWIVNIKFYTSCCFSKEERR